MARMLLPQTQIAGPMQILAAAEVAAGEKMLQGGGCNNNAHMQMSVGGMTYCACLSVVLDSGMLEVTIFLGVKDDVSHKEKSLLISCIPLKLMVLQNHIHKLPQLCAIIPLFDGTFEDPQVITVDCSNCTFVRSG